MQGVGEHNHPARPCIGAPLESTSDGQRGTSQHLRSASVQMCSMQQRSGEEGGESGLQNARVLDRPAGRQLLALAQAICLQRCKEGKGLA